MSPEYATLRRSAVYADVQCMVYFIDPTSDAFRLPCTNFASGDCEQPGTVAVSAKPAHRLILIHNIRDGMTRMIYMLEAQERECYFEVNSCDTGSLKWTRVFIIALLWHKVDKNACTVFELLLLENKTM